MIKKTEIEKAQKSWGNGIITIGKLKDSHKECRIFTVNFINKHYDFGFGDVQLAGGTRGPPALTQGFATAEVGGAGPGESGGWFAAPAFKKTYKNPISKAQLGKVG